MKQERTISKMKKHIDNIWSHSFIIEAMDISPTEKGERLIEIIYQHVDLVTSRRGLNQLEKRIPLFPQSLRQTVQNVVDIQLDPEMSLIKLR